MVVKIVENVNIQIIADHIIADSAVKSVMKFLNILQN